MNKVAIAGIIVAAAIIIGVISAFSYINNPIIKIDEKGNANSEAEKTGAGKTATPKKYSVNLTEAIGAGSP